MPKRARSGAVSRPLRVVAPTKVNGLRSIWMDRAEGPLSIMMSMRKSSIAEYRYSSTTGERRWISSMKSTSLRSSEVRMPARSPGLSRTGPEVILKPTPNSLAMMLLKVVFPSPGGPWSKVWSSGSPRYLAASTNTRRLSTTPCWPLKSSKRSGLSAFSNSFSAVESGRCSLISKFSAINLICKYTKKRPHGKGNGAFSSSATLCEASSAGSCVHSLAAKPPRLPPAFRQQPGEHLSISERCKKATARRSKLYLFVKNATKRENNLVYILQKGRLVVYLQHNVNF